MSKIATRIQSRLTRKHIKVTLGEIKDALCQIAVDADNPTNDEVDSVTEYFVNQFSKPVPQEQETEPLETVSDDNVSEEIEQQAFALSEDNQIVVSDADKQALVNTQSSALGFTLTEEETTAIADSIDDVFADYSSFVVGVTAAIKGYIASKFDEIESELDSSGNDLREYLADRNSRLNQKLSNYADNVRSIKTDAQSARENLKTSKETVLSRFRRT
ncbi:hypothetical protein [Nostoc sp. 2RC]|uniref:hypothetical protein n=1 Tax=Nostoc sp. 2RC TaxID=2485484 RepID=UPI001623FAFB|nr:hypothetical protein [Nostoc sp. 2RC]MBC1237590.1 hypothetical protein [Nostoc sp. 2RC]